MRPCDFLSLMPDEFQAVLAAWSDGENGRLRDGWERARTVAAIAVQPHIRRKMKPTEILRLPWDDQKAHQIVDHEKDKARFEELVKKLKE